MRGRWRQSSRLGVLVALSLALHAAVLAWLAWSRTPDFLVASPDPSLMSVELMRPRARSAKSRPSRLVRRAERASFAPARVPSDVVASPPTPALANAAPAAAGGGPAPAQAGPSEGLRAALRAGAGCARSAGQSREDRDKCEERLGRLQANGPSYPAPMDPEKRAYYDAVVAAGPSGGTYGDTPPGAVSPGAAYGRLLNCSIKFGAGAKQKARQGEVRLGRTPCVVPVQGNFFAPEAGVRKR